jgi:sortase A
MKLKSILLIAIGVIIIAYPIVNNTYTKYKQQVMLNEWEKEMQKREQTSKSLDNSADDESNENQDELTEDPSEDAVESYLSLQNLYPQIEEDDEDAENENSTQNDSSANETIETIGVLKIDKIKAKLPVMNGTSASILKLGVGKIAGTSDFGEIGNTALSAHRSHSYGRNFNRLNEVKEGDPVSITTMDAVYNYEVFNILIVEPSDVSVLKKSKTESILTLITCHPLYTATHRLIVQAKLLPEQ